MKQNYIRKKEKLFWQQKRQSLRFLKTKNPNDFLKNLNLQRRGVPFKFNKNKLYNYFKGLSGNEPADSHLSEKIRENQTEDEFNNLENMEMLDILNRAMSRDEIKK